MRAGWYEWMGPAREVMIVGDLQDPVAGPNQVLVRIAASGISPHDTKSRSGWAGHGMRAPQTIPHADGAGTIVAVGPGVDEGRIGERVWIIRADTARPGGGTCAELAVVRASHAFPLPADISWANGATMGGPAITAHTSVMRDGTVSGQTVLVQGGAGAVGQYAIQFARWSGARVIATGSNDEKRAVATACGADAVLDYRRPDFAAAVMELTDGRGVDRIIEVDFGENLANDIAVIKLNGTIASYSSTRVREPVVDYYALARKGITLHVIQNRDLPEDRRAAAARDIGVLLRRGLLRHPEPAPFPLEKVAEAHELVETGAGVRKVIVTFGQGA